MLKADFHMHTHFSPDSEMAPEQLVRRCKKVGLTCIAVTDHNTTEGAFEVRELADFRVIIGEEVGTPGGLATVIVGHRMKESVSVRYEDGRVLELPLAEVTRQARSVN